MKFFVPKIDHPFTVRGTEIRPDDTPEQYLQKLARITLDEMFQLVGVLTTDGILLECNRAALVAGGLTRDDVIGKPFWETYWWTCSAKTQDDLRRAIARAAKGEFVRYDTEVYGRKGGTETMIMDFMLLPVMDEEGRTVFLLPEGRDITEKKTYELEIARIRDEAEAQVRRSRDQLRLTTDSVPSLISYLDAERRYQFCNQTYLEWFGLAPEDIIGKHIWEVLGDEAWEAIKPHMDAAFGGETADFETEVKYKSGGDRWIQAVYTPHRTEEGAVTGVVAMVTDITDRKRTEEALRESEKRFRNMADNAPVMVWVTDPTAYCTFLSKSWYEFTGQTPETGLGLGWIRATHPDDQERSEKTFIAANEKREPFRLEYRLRRKDGSYAWAIDAAAPRFSPQGEFLGYIGSVIDITDRRRAEEALRESERRFREMIDAVPAAIYTTDAEGRLTHFNPAAVEFSGRVPELGADRWCVTRNLFHPDGEPMPHEECPMAIALKEGRVVRGAEAIAERPDGTRIWFTSYPTPLRDSAGRVVGGINMLMDITERKRAEQEREQLLAAERAAREAADAASRAKDEFLATVSHELRTPLNSMLGWARLLSGSRPDEETAARGLATIERNAKAQAQLIEDLLDVSRIITGKFRLNNEPVRVVGVIEAAVDSVRPAAEAKGVRLQVTLDPDAGPISGDAGRIQQVVWNLLSNAVKFTPKGGRVQVLLARINSHIEIVVSDTGQGVEPEFLPHVFKRFSQADSSSTRSHGGLGLGLAIVRHIVEMHGGEVSVDSMGKGRGTTFTVKLPVMVIRAKPGDSERVHPRVDGENALQFSPSQSLEGIKVLLVDDDPETLLLLSTVLTQSGASVKTAPSAEDGFRELKAWRPDIVVSDVGMPGEDGHSFMRRVKTWASESGVRIPAVALTAYARTEDRMKALSSGYQMHVPKPVEPAELITVIANLVERPSTPRNGAL